MVGKVEKSSLGTEKHSSDATCILFHADHVFSGGADGKIKIWNKDLELVKEISAHESYIYAIVINGKGRLYSSSCDGTVKYFEDPLNSDTCKVLMRTEHDEIAALVCIDDVLYTGDDKGVVIKWVDNKITFKYNLVEEVRSLAVENTFLYTARDLDAVVTDLGSSKTGQYVTINTTPGRAPLALIGPTVDQHRKYLVFLTRCGKGVILLKNERKFPVIWTKEDAHEMIINTICGTDSELYTAGYDGKIKKWVELEHSPHITGEASVENCINAICVGPNNTVYVADSRGMISRVNFTSKAG